MFEIPKAMVTAGIPTLAGVVALTAHLHLFGLEDDLGLSGGHGTLETIEVTLPELCQDQYTDYIKGAEADWSKKVTIHGFGLPTGISQNSKFNGHITNKVCRDAGSFKADIESDGSVHVKIGADAYHTFSYITDPSKDAPYTSHNGPLSLIGKNFENVAHVVPGIEFKGGADGKAGAIGGIAVMEALRTSSGKCGPLALSHMVQMQTDSVKQSLQPGLTVAKLFNPDLKVDMNKVVVDLPDSKKVHVTNQYEKLMTKMLKAGNGDNADLKVTQKSTGTCKESPKLKKFLASHKQAYGRTS